MANNFFQNVQHKLDKIWTNVGFTALIFIEIAIIVSVSYFMAQSLRNDVGCDWARLLEPAVCQQAASAIENKKPSQMDATSDARIAQVDWGSPQQLLKRANEQRTTIQIRKRLHLEMLVGFYKAYCWSILAVLFSAPFAAITLVLLGNDGLSKASPTLRATFFATTITAAVAGAIPSIFGHQSSISANQALFLAYEDLDNEIKTYFDSGYRAGAKEPTPATDKTSKVTRECVGDCLPTIVEMRKFIGEIDQEMKRLNKIAVAVDSSKIPAFSISTGKN